MNGRLTRFFHPVLASRALGKKPVRVVIGGEKFALWRDASGAPCAVVDACPHRNAPLSLGRVRPDGRLACAYHGWNFDGAGQGACPSQPTLKCKTRSFRVVERDGYLWLGDDDAPLEPFVLPAFEGFVQAASFSTFFDAPLHVTLDNFTEDEHFPYVHGLFGWEERDWDKVSYEANTQGDQTEAFYCGPQRGSPLLPLIGVRAGDLFHNRFVSRFDPVRTTYTSHWTDPSSGAKRPIEARTVVFMVPETERTTRFHTFVYVKIADGSGFRHLLPMVRQFAHYFVRIEWWMDARWVRNLADTGRDLSKLRLGKFDKTILKNRKLLERVYFGQPAEESRGHADRSL